MGPQPDSNELPQSTGQANLSCQECRRRKIKCDRQLPTCVACTSYTIPCVYPAGPLKPGPKPGAFRRSKKRRLEASHPPTTTDMRFRTTLPQQDQTPDLGPSLATSLPGKLASLDGNVPSTPGGAMRASDEPSGPSIASQSPEQSSFLTHRRLSWLVHPNHEPTLNLSDRAEESTGEPSMDQVSPFSIPVSLMDQICHTLQTDERDIHHLIALYFENMLSFTLFTPHLLGLKLQTGSPSQVIALLAAMFSFSARFRWECPRVNGEAGAAEQQTTWPAAKDFYLIAKRSVDRELMDLRSPPPLLVVQSMLLLTFYDLVESAEGRGWRSVGSLVRIAYELRLHLVDGNASDPANDHPDLWHAKEERRRTWWAIWELDAFSSTVRRLPSAIDWNQNWTWLPVDDESWLQKTPRPSCYLVADPMERFKALQRCNNQSAKAWFIVANSLMRTAYCIANSQEYFWTPPSFHPPHPGRPPLPQQEMSAQIRKAQQILSNSLYCFSVALPRHLRYRGQHLFSNVVSAPQSTRKCDSDIYSIHTMVKLTDFMLSDSNGLGTASRPAEPGASFPTQSESLLNPEDQQARELEQILARNISMAEAVLSLVRSSGPDHVHLVNPFLASTIWLAAAVFLAYRYLGIPTKSSQERLLVESKIDLLKTIFRQFVQWWGMSDILESKLSELETELLCMRKIGRAAIEDLQQHAAGKAGQVHGLPSIDTHPDTLPSPENSDEPAIPYGMSLHATSQMANTGNPPGNADALDGNPILSLMQDRGSSFSTYDTGSGLFDGDFFYNLEFQGFLDGMFATFQGQDVWK
ncbi:hypothetical protein BDV27DRAFT_148185 [Aspergillus caelatus]|uniref:Zn(2)-C6 fungal-type domain-containing protein n=1 Tax=Aspergillus caelatus TaxID=61420 RepID=A0A5N6ZVM4_9EURO|nr:uncharacterized protein BDV27DRAFT_148185 [Aspergillus caelatus]KAE8360996.1 hypothetical protein BDV27DRAFT_148185 [Aspergillus caelatus]